MIFCYVMYVTSIFLSIIWTLPTLLYCTIFMPPADIIFPAHKFNKQQQFMWHRINQLKQQNIAKRTRPSTLNINWNLHRTIFIHVL